MEFADIAPFLAAWLRNPMRVASVTPSSATTAALVTREIDANSAPVIELGPGTGPFTRALLGRGVAERDLILVERGADFARMLRARFPAARVEQMDAAHLGALALPACRPAGAVVSGLGLTMMSETQVEAIIDGAFRHLRPGGAFFQITYHPRCPLPAPVLRRLGLEARCTGWTLRNLPPVSIYRFARCSDRHR